MKLGPNLFKSSILKMTLKLFFSMKKMIKLNFSLWVAALQEILSALTTGDGVEALEEAREAIGNDMVGLMTQVFPLVTQITIDVIGKYGFSQDGVGKILNTNFSTII